MPVAKTTLETFVSPDELKELILDFESYPEFLPEVSKVEVKEKKKSSALVTFHIAVAFGGCHLRGPSTVLCPVADDVALASPEADGDPCGVGGTQRRRLGYPRATDVDAELVCLKLHEQLIGDHAAVDAQFCEFDPGIRVHGVHDLPGLEGGRLEGRAGDVALRHVAGESE